MSFICWRFLCSAISFYWGVGLTVTQAEQFRLPTANHALFEPGGEERFFVGTVGKSWTSGTFGCVRSGGWQMHEGLDIRCLKRDKRGEPIDPVMATADGRVAYINSRPSLSNYGNYIVLRHQVEGIELFSLYAHLKEIRADLRIGHSVKAGEPIAIMGRTTNTREGISKERAHVHFEFDCLLNERFPAWYQKTFPNQRNDHGPWNGQNLVGLDARLLLLAQQSQGAQFSLLNFVRSQTPLCHVWVPQPQISWVKRFPGLVRANPVAERDGVSGYEVALNFNGFPFELIPRAAAEINGKGKLQLVSVNGAEHQKNPCRRLIAQKGSRWEMTQHGLRLLELLTY